MTADTPYRSRQVEGVRFDGLLFVDQNVSWQNHSERETVEI